MLLYGKEIITFYDASRGRGESYGSLTKIHSYIMDKFLANARQKKSRISLILHLKCNLSLSKYFIKLLYSIPKSTFCLCSSFLKPSAFAETKASQVCAGLCIFNMLFAEVATFSVSVEVAT